MVRDARRCRAPHQEGRDLILRSHAQHGVSKDEATEPENALAPYFIDEVEKINRPARLQAGHAFGGDVAEQQADSE